MSCRFSAFSDTARPMSAPIVPDESNGVTRATPSRRARAASRSSSDGRSVTAQPSRSTPATIRSTAVSGSISRRCTAAIKLGQLRLLRDRRLDAGAGPGRRGADDLVREISAPARLELPGGRERVAAIDERAPERVDALARGPPR